MAGIIIYIVPEKANFLLSEVVQLETIRFMVNYFKQKFDISIPSNDIYFQNDVEVAVCCCMENCPDFLTCSNCNAQNEIGWYTDQINLWYDNTAREVEPHFQCPHCHQSMPAHLLASNDNGETNAPIFEFGFSKQWLEIWNPDPFIFFTKSELLEIGAVWGCPVYQIYARL